MKIHECHPEVAAQIWAEYAKRLVIPVARQVGLPVDMPAVQQGIANLIPHLGAAVEQAMKKDGMPRCVLEQSQMFAALAQQVGFAAQDAQTTYLQPGPAGGNGHGPVHAPAPATAPIVNSRAAQEIRHAHQNPNATPLPQTAIIPGQPLPPMKGPGGVPGVIPGVPGPVPLQAPFMHGPANDAPPGATDTPAQMPSFD